MLEIQSTFIALLLLASPCYQSPFISSPRSIKLVGTLKSHHAALVERDDPPEAPNSTISTAGKAATDGVTVDATQANTDFALAVCGQDGAQGVVASDSRNADLWTSQKLDDWFANALQPYLSNGWKAPDGTQKKSIQSIILTLMGADGSDQCDEITDPNCSGQGLNWEKCKAHPEAHFLWFANTHWAHFLNKMQETLQNSDLALDTNKLTKQFYTPQKDPQQILVPLAILAGIAGALSVAFPPGGVIAGGLSIAQGVVIQAGLDKTDPLKQWADVTSSVATSFKLLTGALEKIFQSSLSNLPDDTSNYLKDPIMEPSVFTNGVFTGTPQVGSINQDIYSGLAAGAINTLWASDSVFLMILDDDIWGKGPGEACKALPNLTLCIDGVAYLLLRWKLSMTKAAVTPGNGANPNELDFRQVPVWGAGPAGGTIAGQTNDNHVKDYGLDIGDVMKSIQNTWDNHGQQFPFQDQNKAIVDYLNSHPTDPQLKDFLFFSLPVCNLKAIFGDGKHIDHETDSNGKHPIEMYGACLCTLDPKWPKDKYPLGQGLGPTICKKEAIKNN